jgi:Helix-turn-helix domain
LSWAVQRAWPPTWVVGEPTATGRVIAARPSFALIAAYEPLATLIRTSAGMTVEEVASRLLCSASKISRMETGQRAASQRDVRDLCGIYVVSDPGEQDRLMYLAQGRKRARLVARI